MIPLEVGMVFKFSRSYGLEIITGQGNSGKRRWITYQIIKNKASFLSDNDCKYMHNVLAQYRIQPFKLELLHILYKGE